MELLPLLPFCRCTSATLEATSLQPICRHVCWAPGRLLQVFVGPYDLPVEVAQRAEGLMHEFLESAPKTSAMGPASERMFSVLLDCQVRSLPGRHAHSQSLLACNCLSGTVLTRLIDMQEAEEPPFSTFSHHQAQHAAHPVALAPLPVLPVRSLLM